MAKLIENSFRASWQIETVLILGDVIWVVPREFLHVGMGFEVKT